MGSLNKTMFISTITVLGEVNEFKHRRWEDFYGLIQQFDNPEKLGQNKKQRIQAAELRGKKGSPSSACEDSPEKSVCP